MLLVPPFIVYYTVREIVYRHQENRNATRVATNGPIMAEVPSHAKTA